MPNEAYKRKEKNYNTLSLRSIKFIVGWSYLFLPWQADKIWDKYNRQLPEINFPWWKKHGTRTLHSYMLYEFWNFAHSAQFYTFSKILHTLLKLAHFPKICIFMLYSAELAHLCIFFALFWSILCKMFKCRFWRMCKILYLFAHFARFCIFCTILHILINFEHFAQFCIIIHILWSAVLWVCKFYHDR